MKIANLLSNIDAYITNEEYAFITSHDRVKINNLDEHQQWVAQNLVRKGLYSISKDNNTLIKKTK